MKQLILTASLAAIAALRSMTATAQPTLTASTSVPAAGTNVRMLFTNSGTTTNSMAALSGANQTWDVSSFAFTKRTDSLNFHACSANDDCSRYPGTTILSSNPQVNGVAFYYYAASSATLSRVGNNDSVAGTSFNHIYTNPQDILHFPMTYNNSFVDSFAILDTASNATLAHYRRGNDTVLADGWGTLKTPSGTFTNTLRVKETINLQDSSRNGLGNVTVSKQRYMIYSWYDANHGHYLTQIFEAETSPGTFVQYSSYADVPGAPTGIATTIAPELTLTVMPNPASANTSLALRLSKSADVSIIVTDLVGKSVYSVVHPSCTSGDVSINLATENLPSGLYLIRVNAGGATAASKLVKQ